MKRIALVALASIALFATVATAHQNGWGSNHMRNNGNTQQTGYSNGNCPMGGNMMGNNMMRGNQGMMNGNRGMMNSTQPPTAQSTDTNWRANPSYQGQTGSNGATSK